MEDIVFKDAPFSSEELEAMRQAQQDLESRNVNSNFGKLNFVVEYLRWPGDKQAPVTVQLAEWMKLKPGERGTRVHLRQNIQELKPDLQFDYRRRLEGSDATRFANNTAKALGMKKDLMDIVVRLQGKYAETQDIATERVTKDGKPVHACAGVVRVFNTFEECRAAWAEKFKVDLTALAAIESADIPDEYKISSEKKALWVDMLAEDFAKACAAVPAAPPAIRAAAISKIAADYEVSDEYVKAHVA